MVHVGCVTNGDEISVPWANNDPRWDYVVFGALQGYASDVFIKTGTDVHEPARIPPC